MIHAVNLIPAARLARRRRRRRLAAWSCALGLAALVVGTACLAARAARSGVGAGQEQAARDIELGIERVKRVIAERQTAYATVRAGLLASELIKDQPDWGLLLVLVSRRLGPDTALTRARLEPLPSKPGEAPAAHFELEGIGRTHDAVSRLAIDLESAGVFSSVRLVQTRRVVHAGADAVSFQVQCRLEGLPGDQP